MGGLIKKVIIDLIDKGRKVDSSDFLTQDTVNWLIEIGKEIIKP